MAKKAAAKKAVGARARPGRGPVAGGGMPVGVVRVTIPGEIPIQVVRSLEPADEFAKRLNLKPAKAAVRPAAARRSAGALTAPAGQTSTPMDAETLARLQAALAKYGPELWAYPDVVAVGYGFKVTEGKMTAEPALCVQVLHKFDDESIIPENRLLPKTLGGFAIDVTTQPRERAAVGNFGQNSFTNNPLVKDNQGRLTQGTLGAIVFIDGFACAVSNIHVWGSTIDREVYLPVSNGGAGSVPFGYTLRAARSCDACTAVIDGAVASYDNRINFGAGPIVIQQSAEPIIGELVWKCGGMTGVTVGKVSQVHSRDFGNGVNAMYYTVTPAGGNEVSRGGDSGSIVVNAQGQAVGLLWGGEPDNSGQPDYFAMDPMPRIQQELGFSW